MLNVEELKAMILVKQITPAQVVEKVKEHKGAWLCLNTEQDPILSLELIFGEDDVQWSVVIDGPDYEEYRDLGVEEV